MKKLYVLPISLAAALCASLLFSCSSDSSDTPTPNEGISSSSAEAVPNYCVYIAERLCLRGANPCLGDGIPSDDCPFPDAPPLDQSSDSGSPNGSNSSGVKPSSSSGAKPSSASVVPSSNSNVPSSPSTTTSSTSIAQSSSSAIPSSSSLTVTAEYTLYCDSYYMPESVYEGASITKPEVHCSGNGPGETPGGLTWTGAPNWSKSVEGTYNVSVSTSTGNCSGQTASCGTVTVLKNPLTCTIPTSGKGGEPMTPTVSCNGTAVSSGLTWRGTPSAPNWNVPMEGTYTDISVSAGSGECSGRTATCKGPLIVTGASIEDYKTVTIGTQTWMAENLNYNVSGSKCYDNKEANCTTYGRLYDWETAMNFPYICTNGACVAQISAKHRGICPSGWHIPSDAEWATLIDFVGGSSAGNKLKATSASGTDDYGFAALLGGYGNSSGTFNGAGSRSYWWSSREGENDKSIAYCYGIGSDNNISNNSRTKEGFINVRCIKD